MPWRLAGQANFADISSQVEHLNPIPRRYKPKDGHLRPFVEETGHYSIRYEGLRFIVIT